MMCHFDLFTSNNEQKALLKYMHRNIFHFSRNWRVPQLWLVWYLLPVFMIDMYDLPNQHDWSRSGAVPLCGYLSTL